MRPPSPPVLVLALVLVLVRACAAQFTPHGCYTCKACKWQCGIRCGGPQNIGRWECSATPTLQVECECALSSGAVAAIVFACLGGAALIAVLAYCYKRQRAHTRPHMIVHNASSDGHVLAPNSNVTNSAYSYSAVSVSTSHGAAEPEQ